MAVLLRPLGTLCEMVVLLRLIGGNVYTKQRNDEQRFAFWKKNTRRKYSQMNGRQQLFDPLRFLEISDWETAKFNNKNPLD